MLPGGPGGDPPQDPPEDPPGDPPGELGRFKAFLFYDVGPGGRGPSGFNLARKSGRVRAGILVWTLG